MTTGTVVIKVPPCDGNPNGEVTINACDYDSSIHQLVGVETVVPADQVIVVPIDPESVVEESRKKKK